MTSPYLGKTGAVPKKGKVSKKQKSYNEMSEARSNKREDTLWKWFSLFVRLRECPDNSQGFARCFTCGRVHHYKEMDAGHYMSRRHKATKYDENNVRGQCVHCNRDLSGNIGEYERALGSELAESLRLKSKEKSKKMPLWEVESKIAEYRQKAKDEAYRVGVEL